jgi:hypothetical protein
MQNIALRRSWNKADGIQLADWAMQTSKLQSWTDALFDSE